MWFAVSLLYEGRSAAKPEVALWQENIRLVEAASEEEARAVGAKLGKSGEHSYQTDDALFTWTFKSVLGTFLIEDFSLESGVEIFSRFLKKGEAESLLTSFD